MMMIIMIIIMIMMMLTNNPSNSHEDTISKGKQKGISIMVNEETVDNLHDYSTV